jgi:hypothetical protein
MALIIAFVSLGLVLVAKYWEGGGMDTAAEVGFGFFITSFLMAFSDVVESTVSLSIRVFQGEPLSDTPREIDPDRVGKKSLSEIVAITVLSLLFSTLGVVLTHWLWFGLILPYGVGGLYLCWRLTRP